MSAQTIRRLSSRLVAESDRPKIEAVLNRLAEEGELPFELAEAIQEQVRSLAEGRDLLVADRDAFLTSTQAAELLACSRPYLVTMVERGEIPCEYRGRDRRFRARDVESILVARAEVRMRAEELLRAAAFDRDERVRQLAELDVDRARELGL